MFAGHISFHTPVAQDLSNLDAIIATLSPFADPANSGITQFTNGFVVEQTHLPDGRETLPFVCSTTGIVVCFWGRIDNRDTVLQKLAIKANPHNAAIVLAAYQKWGVKFAENFQGDFAIAIYDPRENHLIFARDIFGAKPIYYAPHDDGICFANSIPTLRKLVPFQLQRSHEWMAKFILSPFAPMHHEKTAFETVIKVAPGHVVVINADKTIAKIDLSDWDEATTVVTQRDPKNVTAHRNALEAAIASRIDNTHPMGVENSGGLDSTSIIALLAKQMTKPVPDGMISFSRISASREEQCIQDMNALVGIKNAHMESPTNDDPIETITQDLAVLGFPACYGCEISLSLLATAAQKYNIKTMFTGFGGDEVATNYGELISVEYIQRRDYRGLWQFIPGHFLKKPFRFIAQILLNGRDKNQQTNIEADAQYEIDTHLLDQDIVDQYDLEATQRAEWFDVLNHHSINSEIVNGTLTQPFIDARMHDHTLFGNAYGIEYRWPLWDVRIVENYLRTPSIEKVGPKRVWRYLHRRAVDDILPASIVWQNSKHMGKPIMTRDIRNAKTQCYNEMARELLDDLHPDLVKLVNVKRLSQQIDAASKRMNGEVDEEDTFYWERVHNLYSLNLWCHQD
ncbi:hypothetical protein GCM10008927_25620 [Amylibacter ulvae]|uniref:asparagine synthase (glutamine-hydrolyzing) n=1 Tax=Paramylibacter ulvae TaxID=1651968 RepID=A0ABQ3D5L7_9RHOB|nr:asparagine synthase-related protein [Amylibacter ulvae]GHA58840.1 hypothetical protein GCM10008927_25620 [Amylibacter ulvae]